ncbi:hypothetical protein Tco_0099490 [Tanacetum coccineum]
MYDYGHLEEIKVRRDDQKLYMFKEGDFKRLRLQDIEDMLLLLVQQKLPISQSMSGVKSYPKKLNLTKPDTVKSNLRQRTTDVMLDDVRSTLNDIAKRNKDGIPANEEME